jgi:hypothetical protein
VGLEGRADRGIRGLPHWVARDPSHVRATPLEYGFHFSFKMSKINKTIVFITILSHNYIFNHLFCKTTYSMPIFS